MPILSERFFVRKTGVILRFSRLGSADFMPVPLPVPHRVLCGSHENFALKSHKIRNLRAKLKLGMTTGIVRIIKSVKLCGETIMEKLQKLEKLYEGKAKKLYKTDVENVLWVEYLNQATAGNGVKKEQIEGKGRLNNKGQTP